MNLWDICLLNLKRRKAKAAFVLAGLLCGVSTLVALVSLSQTLSSQVSEKLEKYGANILITPKTERLSLSYEGMSLGGFAFEAKEIQQKDLKRLSEIPNAANVAAVGPMVLGPVEINRRKALLAGVDFKSVDLLKPWWRIRGEMPGGNRLLLGSESAKALGLTTGDEVNLAGRGMLVSGVLEPTGSQDDNLIFAPLSLAQAILDKPGLVSMVEVAALCKDCPVEDMVSQISSALPGAKVTAIQSVVKGRMRTIGQLRNFSLGVSALVALAGGLVVLVTMMASVKERTIEIGVFRALGFRRRHVMQVILSEAFLLSLLAGVLGLGLGLGLSRLALPLFSQGVPGGIVLDPMLAIWALGLSPGGRAGRGNIPGHLRGKA
jgi:putative ABC transport system permease protein